MSTLERRPPGTFLTWPQIDCALASWQTLLQTVDDNLRELDEHPTLRKLEGRPGEPPVPLEGETATRVGPALQALREVWAHRDQLSEVIEQATELRRSVRPWSEARQAGAIDALLYGPSIVLRGPTVPLALRTLATSAQQQRALTPTDLIEGMQRAFAEARDAILAVEQAWERLLPSLTTTAREIDRLQERARALGLSLDAECDELRATVHRLRQRVERDPLGAQQVTSADLTPRLEQLRGQIDAFEQMKASVLADLTRSDGLLDDLRAKHAALDEARRRCAEEIRAPVPVRPVVEVGQIGGLESWFVTLVETAQEGRWHAARVGLDRLLATTHEYLSLVEEGLAASSALLARRDQLAGLLRARHAQADDLARQGLYLSAEAERAYRQAVALLAERPCDPDAIEDHVGAYDAAVSALARSTRRR